MSEPWIRDPRPPAQIAAEFWIEQRALRERREEIAAMPRQLERLEATMKDVWTADNVERLLFEEPLLFRSRDDALDQWLAEDGRVPEVAKALGL